VPDNSQVCIAVDHTGGYYSAPIVYFLTSRGYTIYYLASRSIKDAKERFLHEENKTDKLDSAMLAYLLYLRDAYGSSLNITATIADLESRAALLRSLVLQRKQYVKLAHQAANRLHQYLLAIFPEGELTHFTQLLKIIPFYPTPLDMLKSNRLEKIKGINEEKRDTILTLAKQTVGVPGDHYRWAIQDLCTQLTEAKRKSESMANALKKEVEQHPYGEILLSFPFISEITSATLIGIIRDINYWQNKKKLKKALGVHGREYISGAGSGIRRPGRSGSREAKSLLYLACRGCIRDSTPANDFKDYFEKQMRHNKIWIKAIVSTCSKMAEIIYHCLKSGEKYSYQGKYKLH
jgi:transposase